MPRYPVPVADPRAGTDLWKLWRAEVIRTIQKIFLLGASLLLSMLSCQNASTPATPHEPLAGQLVINEFLAAPVTLDANGDGVINSSYDEFIEIANTTGDTLVLTGVSIYVGTSGTTLRHSFPATNLAPHEAAVVFGGGSPALSLPAHVVVETASSGALALTDTGATIEVRNSGGTVIDSVTYGAATTDVSSNRNPELTGSFVDFTSITGHVGQCSPGKRVNGTNF